MHSLKKFLKGKSKLNDVEETAAPMDLSNNEPHVQKTFDIKGVFKVQLISAVSNLLFFNELEDNLKKISLADYVSCFRNDACTVFSTCRGILIFGNGNEDVTMEEMLVKGKLYDR